MSMRLGRYEIFEDIGRYDAWHVYRAFDHDFLREVAVKVLYCDPDDREPLLGHVTRELEFVQRLHHPNIVEAYDTGATENFVYLVTQYVAGGSLHSQMNEPLPVSLAVSYAVQIALALHHAHQHGVIHRVVSPSHVLLEAPASHHILLTDFGSALTQRTLQVSSTDRLIGIPEYMSPEQALGPEIDERTDIYSLGCVLYEMLAGRPPFRASTPLAILYQQVHTKPTSMRDISPSVPHDLAQILEVALAKKPDDRFSTAELRAHALLPFAAAE